MEKLQSIKQPLHKSIFTEDATTFDKFKEFTGLKDINNENFSLNKKFLNIKIMQT